MIRSSGAASSGGAVRALVGVALVSLASLAQADGVSALQTFISEVKSGRATFTQTVTSPDGKRKKNTTGSFEFQRPNQFRFAYDKPAEQLIVGDGKKVWVYDPDLSQASVRNMDQALGATPVALLAGGDLSRDFTLKAQPSEQGVDWVLATPKRSDGGLQSLRLGFKGRELTALDIVDAFGQRSVMQFSAVQVNAKIAPDRFRFDPPAGTDVLQQP
ncbi:outer membrane lipoprotein chaperone LolA [Roseateles amylovorans]|uniref:Outer-membrane lipoprotein carrier protein n=1 Tax=Roseateles amylovorans TaxID=2978473 RepID=A0ABY6B625_9BURK|nr:outer membrane lipoprotein chaperone LolA [Roseateles amylovorans]UXH80868.1 outer membrane lipoprotein chaperone LolA [Roseateles amylovorans]